MSVVDNDVIQTAALLVSLSSSSRSFFDDVNETTWPTSIGNETSNRSVFQSAADHAAIRAGGGPLTAISLNYSVPALVVVAALLSLLAIATAFGNLLVGLALFRYRQLRTISNCLIGNLALSDFLLATTVFPLSIANECLGRWTFGPLLCRAWLVMDVLYCTASIWNLCLIAVDRFTATLYPVWYRDQRSARRRICVYVGLIWAVSAAICVPPLFGWNDLNSTYVVDAEGHFSRCVLFQTPSYVLYSAAGSFFVPFIVTFVLYVAIFCAMRRLGSRRRVRQTRPVDSGAGAGCRPPPAAVQRQDSAARRGLCFRIRGGHGADEISTTSGDDTLLASSRLDATLLLPSSSRNGTSHVTAAAAAAAGGGVDIDGGSRPPGVDGRRRTADETLPLGVINSRHDNGVNEVTPLTSSINALPATSSGQVEADMTSLAESSHVIVQPASAVEVATDSKDAAANVVRSTSPPRTRRRLKRAATAILSMKPEVTFDVVEQDHHRLRRMPSFPGRSSAPSDTSSTINLVEGGLHRTASRRRLTLRPTAVAAAAASAFAIACRTVSQTRRYEQREMRATVRMAIIIAFFCCMWLGFFVVYVVSSWCPINVCPAVPRPLDAFLFWLGYSNSSVNPILYTIFNDDFRRAFQKILGCGGGADHRHGAGGDGGIDGQRRASIRCAVL